MKNLNYTALALALLVVLMFCLVGVSIAHSSILFGVLFFFLGCLFMGLGLYIKRRRGI